MPGGHAGRLDYARLFAAVAILLTGITGTGYAESPSAPATAESPSAPATAESPRLDRSHRYLSDRVLHLAESINNVISSTFRQEEDHESEMIRRFFGNLLTAYQVEGSHIRVTPRLILTEENGNEYKVDFSARLRLPDLSRRLRLYVDSYDTDYDTMEDIFSTRYRQRLDLERGEGTTAGLTYFFSDHMKRDLSLSTGLKFRPEPSPKIRLRGRVRKSFDIWRAEVAQSGFWSEKDGVGERTEFTLDRPSGEIHLVRLRSSVVWSELSHGVDWGQFASYYANFSSRRSAAIKLGVHGYSHPSWITDQYLIRVAYRKRVHRDWLFLEIEPGLDFFREDDFKISPLINIKLEIVIGSFKPL
jgi:hypothetical protein